VEPAPGPLLLLVLEVVEVLVALVGFALLTGFGLLVELVLLGPALLGRFVPGGLVVFAESLRSGSVIIPLIAD
jgi:hypothetical protein